MAATQLAIDLQAFSGRGAGSDAERRAAGWLASQLRRSGQHARIETFWCRPNWALAHAWHVGLGLVGSLVSTGTPRVGGVLILLALLSVLADAVSGRSPGRRLTPEHASQNVVSSPRPAVARPVRLIITANYDAGRTGLIYRAPLRRLAASARRALGPFALGWLGWLLVSLIWVLATAVLRVDGDRGSTVALLQLVPTVGLVLTAALLLEQGTAPFSPAAGDNGSGAAAAVTVVSALATGLPSHVDVELLLQGASDTTALGLRRYLRAHKRERRAANTIVVGIAACGAGLPRWWISDGQLLPVPYHAELRRLAADLAALRPSGPPVLPSRSRGATPAVAAAAARIPAVTLGALDERGLAPRSHTTGDTAEELDERSIERTVELVRLLVDLIDAYLGRPR